MKEVHLKLGALAMLVALVGVSCTHDANIPDTPAISFNEQIQPIIVSNCATSGCHDGGREFSLETYDEIAGHVKAGDARGSKLYKVITKLWGEEAMPPAGPLGDDQITLIYTWIEQGAKNN